MNHQKNCNFLFNMFLNIIVGCMLQYCMCCSSFVGIENASKTSAAHQNGKCSFNSLQNERSKPTKSSSTKRNQQNNKLPKQYNCQPNVPVGFRQEGDLPPNVGISRKITKFAKEKKAAKTLGTVMGIFIICWLPFFITNVISGVCDQLDVECISNPHIVFPILTWLGWINSCMNPFIYACCSNDFRR